MPDPRLPIAAQIAVLVHKKREAEAIYLAVARECDARIFALLQSQEGPGTAQGGDT